MNDNAAVEGVAPDDDSAARADATRLPNAPRADYGVGGFRHTKREAGDRRQSQDQGFRHRYAPGDN